MVGWAYAAHTTMHDYTKFDSAILDQIKAGKGKFTALCSALRDQAEPYTTNARNPLACKAPAWRVIDRRLQALRRQRAIVYTSKGWRISATSAPNNPVDGR